MWISGSVLLAALLSERFTSLMIGVAYRRGILAYPQGDVKTHTKPIPLLGGASLLIVFLAGLLLIMRPPPIGFFLSIGMIALLGCYKDFKQDPVTPYGQLAIQTVAVAILIGSKGPLPFFPSPVTSASTLNFSTSVLVGLVIINSFNFLDVLDGLAGGIAAVTAGLFIALSILTANMELALVCGWLLGGMLGFLRYNLPPARIFMGDIGSFGLGLVMLFLMLSSVQHRSFHPAWMLLLAILLLEFGYTCLLRIYRRRNPMHGDSQHLSLYLLSRNVSLQRILILAYSLAFVMGGVGLMIAV